MRGEAMWLSRAKLTAGGAVVLVLAALGSGLAYATYAQHQAAKKAAQLTGGDPKRAPDLLRRFGCAACHRIGNVASPGGLVGPELNRIGTHIYIAGVRPNTPQNLIEWIVNPAAVKPGTAMPVTGISQEEAKHVAAYLLTLR